ncbi:hypothetical protein THIX_40006 [Thiomonas sp. X19]|nr:hypothetical protein THIX_40006 [Thiomonas sp. X19]
MILGALYVSELTQLGVARSMELLGSQPELV